MASKAKAARKRQPEEVAKEEAAGGPKGNAKLIWVAAAVFLVLVCAAVVYFGGFLQPQGGTEHEAIALADGTAFGKVVGIYGRLFEGGKNCEFAKFVSFMESQAGTLMTSEEKADLKPHFDAAKQCMPSLSKKAEKQSEWNFRVTYSFEVPSSCGDSDIADLFKEDQMGISGGSLTVDLKEKTAVQPAVPNEASFSSWNEGLKELEASMAEAEKQAGADSKTMLDCSVVGSLAMYRYVVAAMDTIPMEGIEVLDETAPEG